MELSQTSPSAKMPASFTSDFAISVTLWYLFLAGSFIQYNARRDACVQRFDGRRVWDGHSLGHLGEQVARYACAFASDEDDKRSGQLGLVEWRPLVRRSCD